MGSWGMESRNVGREPSIRRCGKNGLPYRRIPGQSETLYNTTLAWFKQPTRGSPE